MTAEQCELEMVHGPSAGERYALTGVNLTIGRDALSDIVIQDPEVSRQHALLIYDLAGHYLIQDLGSTNGTFVNDERLGARPVRLRPSSSISMGGSVTLLFHQESAHEQDSSSDQSSAEKEEGVGAEQAEGEVSQAEPFRSGPLIEVEETAEEIPQPAAAAMRTAQEQVEEAEGALPILSAPSQDTGQGRSPNLILGVVLLLLCCFGSILIFLLFLGGDWLLRMAGLVP